MARFANVRSGAAATLLAGLLQAGCGLGSSGEPPAHLRIPGADPQRGAALAVRYGCGTCHVIPGILGHQGRAGPPLIDWAQRTSLAGHFPNSPRWLVPWLVNAPAMRPGTGMPRLGLSEAEARDVASYLYTIGAAGVAIRPPEPPLEVPVPGVLAIERIERSTAPLAVGAARP